MSRTLIQEVEARGGDPYRYTTGTQDLFFSDLDKRLREKYGKLVDDTEEPSEEDALVAHGRREGAGKPLDGDDDGRTAGIMGGLESGGRPNGAGKPKNGDFIQDLQQIQGKSGFF
jgi:hypothetical protein